MLAAVTAAASYRAAGDVIDLRVAINLTLAASFLASLLLTRDRGFSRRWLAPIGLSTIAITSLNLTAFLLEQFQTGLSSAHAAGLPVLALATMIVGSLWALRIHLTPTGFVLGAVLTAGILWAPWVALAESPMPLALTGLACLGAGVWMRWAGARRAYASYRRRIVLPRLGRDTEQAVVLRALSRRATMTVTEVRPPESEPLPDGVDGERTRDSLTGLAAALGTSKASAKDGKLETTK